MSDADCCRDPDAWSFRQTRLRFMAGEFCLFSWRFRTLLYKPHFTLSRRAADEIRPRFEGLPPEIAAICMHSYPLNGPQRRIALLPDAIRYTPFDYRQYYVALSGTFEQYLAKFKSKHRNELKRALKRFEAASGGAIDIRTYTSPAEMPAFHRLALAVSVRTYQHRLIDTGIPEGEEFAAWLRDSAANGRVLGYVLFLAGAPVAFEYSSITPDGIVVGERIGYDPTHSRLAPGIVLVCCVIRSLLDEHRFRLLDFGGGEAPYKAMLSTHSAHCGDIYYFRRSWANALRVGAHAGLTLANRTAIRLVQAIGLKERLKRLARRASVPASAHRAAVAADPAPPPAEQAGAAACPAERPKVVFAAGAGAAGGSGPSAGKPPS